MTDSSSAETTPRRVFKNGQIEIWEVIELHGSDFYVYGVLSDPIVCPSLEIARARAA